MEMVKAIREAGCTPVQRNTFYEPVRVLDSPEGGQTATEAVSSEHR
jgi:2-iminoacetate synthase ThiH